MVTSTPEPDVGFATASRTRITVERSDVGRVRVGLEASARPDLPLLRPVLVAAGSASARVALVAEGALLLARDAMVVEVHVGAGATLELLEPAGTVAYDMRGGSATWDVDVRLDQDARLLWHGEPFVAAAGSDVRRRTRLRLALGARLALREQLVLGRYGEWPGRVRHRLDATSDDGTPLLVEEIDLAPESTGMLLGGRRVLATVLTLGADPGEPDSPQCLRLECGGTLVRALAGEAHRATLAAAWSRSTAAVGG
ncbi:urease accessory protein UreD [Nocardioides sp. W7]|uniref:urease accessory protein UreD n=1 Tax=Nocardioides sp. W7 TaxID=2931390 RepID=UPI001FD47D90|nr:urease accessory protein UreD [Nocardioides sp. W7]